MAKVKLDGVIVAVHYNPDGSVEWVRAYLRRGATFSDRLLLDRQTLVNYIKSGKQFFIGQRLPLKASTFDVSEKINLIANNGEEVLVIGNRKADRDQLDGVPVI